MTNLSEVYDVRPTREDEVGRVSRDIYEHFNHASYTLSQLNLTRQNIDDWMRFELESEHKRKHCFLLVHVPTDYLCGVILYKSYGTVTAVLPEELGLLAPRHYLFRDIHMTFTERLGLDPARVVYGDFGFIKEEFRGNGLFPVFDKKIKQYLDTMGYTDVVGEIFNPYVLRYVKSTGTRILEERNTLDYQLHGTKPFMRDAPLHIFHRNLKNSPKL